MFSRPFQKFTHFLLTVSVDRRFSLVFAEALNHPNEDFRNFKGLKVLATYVQEKLVEKV